MKKYVAMAVTVACLSSAAYAQDFSITAAFSGTPMGGSVGFTAKNLAAFRDFTLDARLLLDVNYQNSTLNGDILFNYFSQDLFFYFGPTLGGVVSGDKTGFLFGGVVGAAYPISETLDVFLEGKISNQHGLGFRTGVNFYF